MTKRVDLNKFLRNNKAMFLAYDHGFEHGPTDFDEKTIDPNFVIDLVEKTKDYMAIILQEGIAEKYYDPRKHQTPLLVKLNGKTVFHKGEEPYSPLLCTVKEAIRAGAQAVGYTIYVGSEHEAKMMKEFSLVEDEAHAQGLVVTAWMYPRGKQVRGKENTRDILAYAARLGLELGADFIKIPYSGDPKSFEWVVKAAGKAKVLVSGGVKRNTQEFLADVADFMKVGTTGIAVGRNVWQAKDPIVVTKSLAKIIYGK
jgi:class I fructose-bisphosphate aldolase